MPAKAPLRADRDRAHVVVIADAHEDDLGALRRLGRARAVLRRLCSLVQASALAAVRL